MKYLKSFVIHEIKKDLELVDNIIIKEGFKYSIKSSNMGVKEIIIVEPFIIDQLILSNFNRRYKKILEYYIAFLQDEEGDNEGNFVIALDEIARLRSILIKKYNLIVSKKIEEKMLKKLKILENEIRTKIIDLKLIKERECVNTISEPYSGKSR